MPNITVADALPGARGFIAVNLDNLVLRNLIMVEALYGFFLTKTLYARPFHKCCPLRGSRLQPRQKTAINSAILRQR